MQGDDLSVSNGDGCPLHTSSRLQSLIAELKCFAGRTQDLADVEAIVSSGADRDLLKTAVQKAAPNHSEMLERLFENVDRGR